MKRPHFKNRIGLFLAVSFAFSLANCSALLLFLQPLPTIAATLDKRSQAIALYNAKDYKGAAALLDDYLTVNSRDQYASYYGALAYQQLGNTAKARMLYRQVYTLDANSQIGGYAKSMLLKLDPTFAATISAGEASAAAARDASIKSATAAKTPQDIARAIINSDTAAQAQPILDRSLPAECRIPFTRARNGITLDCFLNNRPIKMIFDTGAPGVMLGKNQMKDLGLTEPQGPASGVTHGSASSEAMPVWIMRATVKCGLIEKQNMAVTVVENNHSPPLLGQSFFNSYDYTIDEGSNQLNLRQKALASNQGVSGASVSVPFTYREAGNRVIVQVEVNGKTMPMIFDSGNTANACSFMSDKQLAKCGLKVPEDATMAMHVGVNGSGACKVFSVRRIRLGPIDRNDVMVSVNLDTSEGKTLEDPLLGQPFWQGYEYTIDMKNKLIHFIRR